MFLALFFYIFFAVLVGILGSDRKLGELLEKGLITREEFNAEKSKLLQ